MGLSASHLLNPEPCSWLVTLLGSEPGAAKKTGPACGRGHAVPPGHLLQPALRCMPAGPPGPGSWPGSQGSVFPIGARLAIWGQQASVGPPGCLAKLEIGYVPNIAGNNKATRCSATLCWVNKWKVFQPAEERRSCQSLFPRASAPQQCVWVWGAGRGVNWI